MKVRAFMLAAKMLASVSSAWGQFSLACWYLATSMRRDRRSFWIGCVSVALVVAFSTSLQGAIEYSPVIFLRFSEDQAGEADITMVAEPSRADTSSSTGSSTGLDGGSASPPSFFASLPLLNYSSISHALQYNGDVEGCAPRWIAPCAVQSKRSYEAARAGGAPAVGESSTTAFLLLMDSFREQRIGLGRGWTRRPLGDAEVYVTLSVLSQTGVRAGVGERVMVVVSPAQLLGAMAGSGPGMQSSIAGNGNVAEAAGNSTGGTNILVPMLLSAAGVDASLLNGTSMDMTVDGLTALQTAVALALGPDAVAANNLTTAQLLRDNPALAALGLVRVPIGPLIGAALARALAPANSGSGSGLSGAGLVMEATVVDGIESPQGKWPSILGNVVVMEAKQVALILRDVMVQALVNVENVIAPIAGVLSGNPQRAGQSSSQVSALTTLSERITALRVNAQLFDYRRMREYSMMINVIWRNTVQAGNAESSDKQHLEVLSRKAPMTTAGRGWYLSRSRAEADPLGIVGFADAMLSPGVGSVGTGLGHTYPISITTPLADVLDGPAWQIFSLFLDQILHACIFVLCCLGVLVVYALALGDVESKQFELGMLRALGLRHMTLAHLLSLHTIAFAVPGLCLGLAVASVSHAGLASVLSAFAALRLPTALPQPALILGLCLGVLTPAVAVIIPLRRAMSSNLRQALDVYHSSAGAAGGGSVIKVERLANLGLSPLALIVSALCIGIGFTVLYLLPLAFILRDTAWFLSVLTGILMAMLLGLALVAQSIQPRCELAILGFLLALGRDARLWTVIKKNLSGHRSRNRKSAYMVGISSAFLVFASTAFAIQGKSLSGSLRMLLGSDIVVFVPEFYSAVYALDQQALCTVLEADMALGAHGSIGAQNSTESTTSQPAADDDYYDDTASPAMPEATQAAASPSVAEYTWISAPLTAHPFVRRPMMSNLAGTPRNFPGLYGVQANFMRVAYRELGVVTAAATSDSWADPVHALHLTAGKLRLPIESAASSTTGTAVSDAARQGAQSMQPLGTGSKSDDVYMCSVASDYDGVTLSRVRSMAAGDADAAGGLAGSSSSNDTVLVSWWLSHVAPDWDPPSSPSRAVIENNTSTGNNSNNISNVDDGDMLWRVYLQLLSDQSALQADAKEGWLSAHAQSTPAASEPPPRLLPSFVDYSSCMLFCNGRFIQDAKNRTGRSYAACKNTSSTRTGEVRDSGGNAGYGYWGPGSGFGGVYGDDSDGGAGTPPAIGDAGPGKCMLPSPCYSAPLGGASSSSPAAREAALAAAYTRYTDVIISEALRASSSITPSTPLQVRRTTRDPASGLGLLRSGLAKASSQVRKLPGFIFSSYAPTAGRAPALMRMADYGAMLHQQQQDYDAIRAFIVDPGGWSSTSFDADSERGVEAVGPATPEWFAALNSDSYSAAPTNGSENAPLQGPYLGPHGAIDSYPSTPKFRLLIRLVPGVSADRRQALANALRAAAGGTDWVNVQDTQDLLASASSAINGLTNFFAFTACLCLLLCFFGAWLSFSANVREGSTEAGVLRALGLTASSVTRCFVYEALTVALTACILGTSVGIAVATSLSLQFNLFVEMPFEAAVPVDLMLLFLITTTILAIAASVVPARRLLLKTVGAGGGGGSIANLIKGR